MPVPHEVNEDIPQRPALITNSKAHAIVAQGGGHGTISRGNNEDCRCRKGVTRAHQEIWRWLVVRRSLQMRQHLHTRVGYVRRKIPPVC